MSLPAFSTTAPIAFETARHDKIELTIDLGRLRIAPDAMVRDFETFQNTAWNHFSGPPRNTHRLVVQRGLYSRVFGRGKGTDKSYLQVVNRHRSAYGEGALFTGRLLFYWSADSVSLSFFGYLNPTRYVRHQNPNVIREGIAATSDNDHRINSLFLRRANAAGENSDEFSLDGEDNWIPDTAVWNSYSRDWPARHHEYFDAIRLCLESEISRVSDRLASVGCPVVRELELGASSIGVAARDTTFQRVETYWEFKHTSPLSVVDALEPELRAYTTFETTRREFQRWTPWGQPHFETTDIHACRVLDAVVAPGIRLVIYAKTNQRVRFEIRHFLPDIVTTRRFEYRSRQEVEPTQVLADVTRDATRVLERFFSFLQQRVEMVASSNSPLDLLYQCSKRAQKPIYGDAVLNMLLNRGAVARLPALIKTIRSMVRAGVLEQAPNEQGRDSRSYVLTARYQRALEILRRIEAEQTITGIVRRRRVRTVRSEGEE